MQALQSISKFVTTLFSAADKGAQSLDEAANMGLKRVQAASKLQDIQLAAELKFANKLAEQRATAKAKANNVDINNI